MDPADKQADLQVHNLISELLIDLHTVDVLWQLALLTISLIAAWWISRVVRARLIVRKSADSSHASVKIGVAGFVRVLFPLTMLILVVVGRFVLRHYEPQVSLLNLAVPLIFSWMLTQLALYAVGHALAPGDPLRYWEKVIAWSIWIGVALYISGALPELERILDGFGFHIGKQRISVLTVLEGLLSLAVSILIALWIGRLIEDRLMGIQGVDINVRVVLSKLVKTLLILIAIFIALPMVGIDITVLSVFGGALGVGIGFGLQKIAANYFSGFLILLDRSVSLGALVTIDGYYGEVRRLNARYMVVKGMDGTEAIIPNETVITSVVINHSYTDPRVRIEIPIQISYQSDVEMALKLLVEAALAQDRALRDPAPAAVLKGFGESGIDLELYAWIADPELGKANIRSDIYRNLWQSFRSHGIEIPYPRREIQVLRRSESGLMPTPSK